MESPSLDRPAGAPSCVHRAQVLRPVGTALTVLGLGTGALSALLFLRMRGKPETIIWTIRVTVASAVILTTAGLWLRLKPYWTDPQYRAEKRQAAAQRIRTERVSYPELRSRYGDLFRRGVLHEGDLSDLLDDDVTELTYPQFIHKHSLEVVDHLDADQRRDLRIEFLSGIMVGGLDRRRFDRRYAQEIRHLQSVIGSAMVCFAPVKQPSCPSTSFVPSTTARSLAIPQRSKRVCMQASSCCPIRR